ncbi:RICIN domain-containing protein [Paenibacillus thalictri]|uniref:RICIN domain-containing protein n=1 Tax=Paenibacillus thalictri TaxID=2527873 RepID=UPI0013EF2674|nr:RICIN domain-containing protein [Paenibacillus thalictri]
MKRRNGFKQAFFVLLPLSIVLASYPLEAGLQLGTVHAEGQAVSVTENTYTTGNEADVSTNVYGQLLTGDVQTASMAPPVCKPYGPSDGYQYDPKLLMQKMGSPRVATSSTPSQFRAPTVGPFLSAHRGAWGTDPGLPKPAAENSKTAIDNAASLKFEIVELDVKLTKDDRLVLMHDYTLGRTTDHAQSDGHWDTFRAITPAGVGKVTSGNPPLITNWNSLDPYNPLIKSRDQSEIIQSHLQIFDKLAHDSLGYMNGAEALGNWRSTQDPVMSLGETLSYIGERYPGMTVVLDLRHLDEVKRAMNVIDLVSDCQGTPARNWVILKPFANVYPDGWSGGSKSVLGSHDSRALNYKWIPVVSNRLVPPTPAGAPSEIPSSPGPDPSQISMTAKQYLLNWHTGYPDNVVTFENGYTGNPTSPLKEAYDWAQTFTTNMQSWRSPDINVAMPVPYNGDTIIGFNWKDDGMGAYPVLKNGYREYEQARETAGILTVEDAPTVLKMEVLTRTATTMSISKLIDPAKVRTDLEYRLINWKSLKALDLNNNDMNNGTMTNGMKTNIWNDNFKETEIWRFLPNGDGTYALLNSYSGKALEPENGGTSDGTKAQINTLNYQTGQKWKLESRWNGTYIISHADSGKVLGTEAGGTANGTKVEISSDIARDIQRWYLVPVGAYNLQDQNSKRVVDVFYGLTADGTPIQIYDNNNGDNQKWRFQNNGDGTYTMVNSYSGKALGIYGDVTFTSPVDLYTNTNSPGQKWKLMYNREDETYTFINPNSGMELNVYGDYTTNGTPLIIFPKRGSYYSSNEKFKIGDWGAYRAVAQLPAIPEFADTPSLALTQIPGYGEPFLGEEGGFRRKNQMWKKLPVDYANQKAFMLFHPKSGLAVGYPSSQYNTVHSGSMKTANFFKLSGTSMVDVSSGTMMIMGSNLDRFAIYLTYSPTNLPVQWNFKPIFRELDAY